MDVLFAARRLHLDDRPRFDEQAGDFDRLAQGAAAVATQIDDQQVDAALAFEVFEHLLHIAGRALEVVFAARGTVEVAVERRNVEDSDATRAALQTIAGLNDLAFDLLLSQLNGSPSQRVDSDLALFVLGRVFEIDMLGRFDLQSHLRAARTADQAHDLIQLHFDDGHDLAVSLAVDSNDLVADFETSVLFGGAAGDDLLD